MVDCITAHEEVLWAFTDTFYDIYFETMNRMLTKFYFDVRILEQDLSYSNTEFIALQEEMADVVNMH